MTNRRLAQIEMRIERIKSELAKIEGMRPGLLTRQYKDPQQQTGAYYQLSYTLDIRGRTEYIRKDCVSDVRRQIKQYKRLNAEWVSLGIEYSRLAMKLKHSR